ncbi:MAG: hypothetical protein HDR29_02285 [Lachnospiraceae bacterium]|nr:hypothetical protein [Lachnospiraceae bacterium]
MEDAVLIILITLALLFCAGIACGILSIVFLIKKKHPIISIILSFICWFGICIPINSTIGFFIGRVSMILMGIYCMCVVVCSVIILKRAKK